MRKMLVLAILGSVGWATAPWVSGCSSNAPSDSIDHPPSGSSSGAGSSSGGSSGKSSSSGGSSSGSSGSSTSSGASGSSGSSGDAGVDPDQACYSLGSDACETCCEQHHAEGSSQHDDAYYGCVCDQGRCATQCAPTDCNDSDDAGDSVPGDPCDQCETQYAPDDGGGACGPIVASACNGSPDCVAYTNCSDNCP